MKECKIDLVMFTDGSKNMEKQCITIWQNDQQKCRSGGYKKSVLVESVCQTQHSEVYNQGNHADVIFYMKYIKW